MMLTTHEFVATCTCPVDSGPDTYEVMVETQIDIPVESILAATAALKDEKLYQEEFTRHLARQLGARVTTVGWHSGVRTTCRAPS